jgi:hypothetical protein
MFMKLIAKEDKGMRNLKGSHDRKQSGRLLKLIVLATAITLCGGAHAQSISWLTKGEKIASGDWYLPVLASDYNGDFVVVGQGGTGTESHLKDQTAAYDFGTGYSKTLTWSGTYTSDYTTGHAPSVALAFEYFDSPPESYDVAVEVHQGGQDDGAALWSHVAVTGSPIPATLTWTKGDQYDKGYNPKVAIDPFPIYGPIANINTVVEVHQAGEGISDLWYHVGSLAVYADGKTYLTWGPSYQFDYGYVPSVGVCAGVAVEVHEGDSGSLWYSIGKVDGNKVNWSASTQYDSGRNPSVSMCADMNPAPPDYLVEVHQGGVPATGKSTSLWYHISEYTDSAVTWLPAVKYSTGCYPTVTSTQTLSAYGTLIAETHAGACGVPAPLYYDLGSLK